MKKDYVNHATCCRSHLMRIILRDRWVNPETLWRLREVQGH